MSDLQLMQKIKSTYGELLTQVCGSSSVPASFLGALIANETGGDPLEKRFEPGVLAALWQVLLGRKANYGSIGRADLVAYVADLPAPTITVPAALPNSVFQNLDALANSWGLTQIMGYHALESSVPAPLRPEDFTNPATCLKKTLTMLAAFANEFSLDLANDFEEMLRCWNSGRPDGKTFDPNYVPNGLARKIAYEALP
jgi:hypothetical protein